MKALHNTKGGDEAGDEREKGGKGEHSEAGSKGEGERLLFFQREKETVWRFNGWRLYVHVEVTVFQCVNVHVVAKGTYFI